MSRQIVSSEENLLALLLESERRGAEMLELAEKPRHSVDDLERAQRYLGVTQRNSIDAANKLSELTDLYRSIAQHG